ncbi:MAG: hypothetical protein J5762_00785 [Clostridia bacterium]|nr:hypothetical protein [Clostridia bacterium]
MTQGYFDNKKNEYVITDMFPRRPLIDYLWSDSVFCSLEHFGGGTVSARIDNEKRVFICGNNLVYIKENGEYYSANRNFKQEKFDRYEAHVGLGYHKVVSEYKGIKTEHTIIIPKDGFAQLNNIKVTNLTDKKRKTDLYSYIQLNLATSWHHSYSRAGFDEGSGGLLFTHNGYDLPTKYNTILALSDVPLAAYSVTKSDFTGIYGDFFAPDSLKKDRLSCNGATFDGELCSAMQFTLELKPNETRDINIAVVLDKTYDGALKAAKKYSLQKTYENELKYQKELHEKYLPVFVAETPDEYFDTMINVWLKRQLLLDRGSFAGKGFRDLMQDIAAYTTIDPERAKRYLLLMLKHQYEDGNPIRMIQPNFHYPYNDCGVWITGAVLAYLKETGDLAILNEVLTYMKGDSYENAIAKDAFMYEPYVAAEKSDTVLEHIDRAVNYLINCKGKHGLVLWRGGDWNDSLNNCGLKNVGESVWLSIATVKSCNEYIELLEYLGKDSSKIKAARDELTANILKYGVEDGRFIYGYNDEGDKIGSKESKQAKFYLNPQTWSILSGIVKGEKADELMKKVDKTLKCPFGYQQCYPSYSHSDDAIGRASYFVEGLVENGGVYNHGVAFKIASDCVRKNGDDAYNTLKMMYYSNPENPDNGVEPYMLSNMYIGPECPYKQMRGFAPMSGNTGTAPWIYMDMTEYILGVKADFNGLKVQPCFPKEWDKVRVKRIFRENEYDIEFVKSDENGIIFDGKAVKGNILPIGERNSKHKVTVYFNG